MDADIGRVADCSPTTVSQPKPRSFEGPPNERLNTLLTRQVAAATGTDVSKFDIEKYLRALRSAQMAIDLHPERHKHYHLHAVAEQYREHVDVRTFGRSARASE